MRWKEKPGPQYGDIKVRSKFLLFPEYVKGEWRWLEWVTCIYEYEKYNGWVITDWY